MLFIICIIPIISADLFPTPSLDVVVGIEDDSTSEIGVSIFIPEEIFNSSAATSNSTNFWITSSLGTLSDVNTTQFSNQAGVLNLIESWVDSLWCRLTGCIMEGDIDMDGNDIIDVGNITANNFKGKFNWSTIDEWNTFDGSILTFNETKLDEKLASIEYNASVITTLTGNLDSGNLSDVLIRDNIFYNVSEVNGVPGFNIQLNYTGVTNFNDIVARLNYDGRSSHKFQFELLDCLDGTYHKQDGIFSDTEGVADIIIEVLDPEDHICGLDQNVSLQLIHTTSGNPADDVFIDAINLVIGATTASPTEIDPHSLHKTGDVINEGNQDWGGFNLTNVNYGFFDRVGIGTTTPVAKLHIKNVTVGINDLLAFTYKNAVGSGVDINFYSDTTPITRRGIIRHFIPGAGATSFTFVLDDMGTLKEIVRMQDDGKVGINTINPQNTLNIIGDLNVTENVTFGKDVIIDGTLFGGSPLKVSGGLNVSNGNVYLNNNLSVEELIVRSGESIHLAGADFSNEGYYTSVNTNWIIDQSNQPTAFLGVYAKNGSSTTKANLILESGGSAFNLVKNSPLHPYSPNSTGLISEGDLGMFADHDSEMTWWHYITLDKDEYGNIETLGERQLLMTLNDDGLNLSTGSLIVDGNITARGNIIASIGNVTAPSIHFEINSDTGMYYIHPDKIGFTTSGNLALKLDSYGVMIIDGVANAPSYSFLNDDDSGFYRIGTDNIGLALNGTKRVDFAVAGTTVTGSVNVINESGSSKFFVNATTGRVGIGTVTPDSAFQIKANIAGTVGSHPAGQLIIQNPTDSVTSNVVITAYESDGDGNPDQQLWYLGSSSSSNSNIILLNRRNALLQFGTSGSTRMTILGNGDVGIGTMNPQNKLNVIGDGNFTENLTADFHFLGNGAYIGYNATCQMVFYNSTGGVMSSLGCI